MAGLAKITNCTGKPSCKLPSNTSLPDVLNYFYERFEASNTEACMRAPAVLDSCVITLSVADRSKTFTQVNIHKAAAQMDYQDISSEHALTNRQVTFSTESVTPTCFKQTTIVPVPKNAKVTCVNDYRPVALTSVAMKCFERLVMAHIIPIRIPPQQIHR